MVRPAVAAAQIMEGGIARDAKTRAPFECLHVALVDSSGSQIAHTVTNHSGQFVLEAPRAGKYAVRFQAYGWEPLLGPVDTLHEGDAPQRAYPVSFTNMLLPSARDSQSFQSLPIDKRQDTLEMRRLMDPARRIGDWRRGLEANGTWQSRRIHPASFNIRHPEHLFAERQEGAAIVRFIVDSTGKARADSWSRADESS
jgi:hypothetical protein